MKSPFDFTAEARLAFFEQFGGSLVQSLESTFAEPT